MKSSLSLDFGEIERNFLEKNIFSFYTSLFKVSISPRMQKKGTDLTPGIDLKSLIHPIYGEGVNGRSL